MRHPRTMSRVESSASRPSAVDPVAELLALPAELVPDLPLALSLWLDLEGAPARVLLTTRARPEGVRAESLADVIVFDREELRALIAGVQADRIWRKDVLGACFDKWRKPEHRLTLAGALAGANPDPQQGWTLGRVLARVGAAVASIELADRSELAQTLSEAA